MVKRNLHLQWYLVKCFNRYHSFYGEVLGLMVSEARCPRWFMVWFLGGRVREMKPQQLSNLLWGGAFFDVPCIFSGILLCHVWLSIFIALVFLCGMFHSRGWSKPSPLPCFWCFLYVFVIVSLVFHGLAPCTQPFRRLCNPQRHRRAAGPGHRCGSHPQGRPADPQREGGNPIDYGGNYGYLMVS